MLELIITLILIYCLAQAAGMLKEKRLNMKARRSGAKGKRGKRWEKHNNN